MTASPSGLGQQGHETSRVSQVDRQQAQGSQPTRALDIAGELRFLLQQATWRSRHKGIGIAGKLTLSRQAPAVLANEGARQRRAAFDSKPQRSRPARRETSRASLFNISDTRASTCTSHLRSRPTWHKTAGKRPQKGSKPTTAVTTDGNGAKLWRAMRPCVNNKKRCKPTTVMAKYGSRRRQAARPYFKIIKIREQVTTVVATHGMRRW